MTEIKIHIQQPDYVLTIKKPSVKIDLSKPTLSIGIKRHGYVISVLQQTHAIEIRKPKYEISVKRPSFSISISRGIPGPPGPPGGIIVIYPAGETLSAGRVVIIAGGEVFYFQPSDITHSGRAFGITKTSAMPGDNVEIYAIGEATDASFSAFPGVPLYVIADGELSTTWPVSGLLQKAGFGTGTNKVRIDFSIQIQQI